MYACSNARNLTSPEILQILVQAGVTVAEVDAKGRNCLFNCILESIDHSTSLEFEALRYLLTIFDDFFACDSSYCTIFDRTAHGQARPWRSRGSYRQDMWYCALYRSDLAHRLNIPPPSTGPIFSPRYTKEDYRALLYFGSWRYEQERKRNPDYALLSKDALSERDIEFFPGLREWKPSDLLMMEERIGRAEYVNMGW